MNEKKKTATLGTVLDGLLWDRNWQYRLGLNRVFLFWEEIVGHEMAAVVYPEAVHGAVLWVSVPDSMWMQQLHLQKVALLDKLNCRLEKESKGFSGSGKAPVIEDIRFKIGRPEHLPKCENVERLVKCHSVDPQREHDFDILSQSIKDDELRASMKRLWLGQEKRAIDSGTG